jgi:hypothetical protein
MNIYFFLQMCKLLVCQHVHVKRVPTTCLFLVVNVLYKVWFLKQFFILHEETGNMVFWDVVLPSLVIGHHYF